MHIKKKLKLMLFTEKTVLLGKAVTFMVGCRGVLQLVEGGEGEDRAQRLIRYFLSSEGDSVKKRLSNPYSSILS